MTATHITANLVLAEGHHHAHWIVCVIVLILIAGAVISFMRRRRRPTTSQTDDSPRRILGERFARGEIDGDEYRERLAQLKAAD